MNIRIKSLEFLGGNIFLPIHENNREFFKGMKMRTVLDCRLSDFVGRRIYKYDLEYTILSCLLCGTAIAVLEEVDTKRLECYSKGNPLDVYVSANLEKEKTHSELLAKRSYSSLFGILIPKVKTLHLFPKEKVLQIISNLKHKLKDMLTNERDFTLDKINIQGRQDILSILKRINQTDFDTGQLLMLCEQGEWHQIDYARDLHTDSIYHCPADSIQDLVFRCDGMEGTVDKFIQDFNWESISKESLEEDSVAKFATSVPINIPTQCKIEEEKILSTLREQESYTMTSKRFREMILE